MPEPLRLAFEERGSGPALVLVHGFPFNRTMWIEQLKGLAKIRQVVAVDLRGHGLSKDPNPSEYSMDLFADDIAATMDELGAEQADVCGLSMGGYVLFSLWRRHRARIRSLIFCSTKAEADSDEAKEGRNRTAGLVRESGLEALWEQLGPKLFGPAPAREVSEKVHSMFLELDPEVAAQDALAMRDRVDSSADAQSINVPVLWIHAEQDGLMPLESVRSTAEKIPGVRFVAVPDAGHVAPMENPKTVNDAMAEFLRGVPR